jgi:type III restriction enzyme
MKFEDQDYQKQCVENIINSLKCFDFKTHSKESLKNSLENFYKEDGKNIPEKMLSNKHNIDVLMETGTGKTFTYLKTIFELNKQCNINKFIIFVPRKAIRSGTKQNIELTKSFFKIQYGKEIKLYDYSGDKTVSQVRQFIENANKDPSVLILTNSSIDKKGNILRQKQEIPLFNNVSSLLDAMRLIKPVIIIDEPHLLKGQNFIEEFEKFESLYIRFGATYPKDKNHSLSNTVYILDSISAFQEYLVKKIRVSTFINSDDFVKLKSTNSKNQTINLIYFKNGEELEKVIKVKDDIGEKLGIREFQGIYCTSIKGANAYLSNEEVLESSNYLLIEEEQKVLIQNTIKAHFEKEEELFKKGIKTLSLFFIPSINSYNGENPIIKNIFEEEYKNQRTQKLQDTNISKEYREYLENDYKDGKLIIHQGYFSTSKGSKEEQEAQAIDIILNKKEELLSFKTPLRFLFSVWALQEGWDNPNIFNICKLSATKQETSKRQQVGRGLRIAVNQQGERLTYNSLEENEDEFYNINTLDVIVSSQEKNFITNLQKEINGESYKILDSFTTESIKTKALLNEREANKFINALEDSEIIEFNEDKNEYIIKSDIYEYLEDNVNNLIKFLRKEALENLLKMFKPSTNKHSQIEDKNKKIHLVNVRKDLYKEFKELWETINKKATIVYSNLNEENLINEISKEFSNLSIDPIKMIIKKQSFNSQKNLIEEEEQNSLGNINFFTSSNFFTDFIFEISKVENLPLSFILKLFNKLTENQENKNKISNNPKKVKYELLKIIKEKLHSKIINNVSYNFSSTIQISNTSVLPFKQEDLKPIKHTSLAKKCDGEEAPEHYLYDKIVYDSWIEKEVTEKDPKSVEGNKITVFAKLPNISIPTPFKSYNPDFAYFINTKEGKKLFLVVETKGYNSSLDIPIEEQNKINYARKFFEELQKMVGKDITIKFTQRINKQELVDLIKEL